MKCDSCSAVLGFPAPLVYQAVCVGVQEVSEVILKKIFPVPLLSDRSHD